MVRSSENGKHMHVSTNAGLAIERKGTLKHHNGDSRLGTWGGKQYTQGNYFLGGMEDDIYFSKYHT